MGFYDDMFDAAAGPNVLKHLQNGVWRCSASGNLTSIGNPSKGGTAFKVQGTSIARTVCGRSRTASGCVVARHFLISNRQFGTPNCSLSRLRTLSRLHHSGRGRCIRGRTCGAGVVGADAAAQALRVPAHGCTAHERQCPAYCCVPGRRDREAREGRARGSGACAGGGHWACCSPRAARGSLSTQRSPLVPCSRHTAASWVL